MNIPSVTIEEDNKIEDLGGSIATIDGITLPSGLQQTDEKKNLQTTTIGTSKSSMRRPTLAKLNNFTTMTPQEIAQWIDKRSRIVFPVSFLIFNLLYWSFIWV